MSEEKVERLSKVAKELNVSLGRLVEFLGTKGQKVENNPNGKLNEDQVSILKKEFASSANDKKEASNITFGKKHADLSMDSSGNTIVKNAPEVQEKPKNVEIELKQPEIIAPVQNPAPVGTSFVGTEKVVLDGPKVLGKIDLNQFNKKPEPKKDFSKPAPVVAPQPQATAPKSQPTVEEKPKLVPVVEVKKEIEVKVEAAPVVPQVQEEVKAPIIETPANPIVNTEGEAPTQVIEARADSLKGLTVLGKLDLSTVNSNSGFDKNKKNGGANNDFANKKKRNRIVLPVKGNNTNPQQGTGNNNNTQGGGGQRPPYQGNNPGGQRPPYQGNNPGGQRPPYQGNNPSGQRPPYQGNNQGGASRGGYQGNRGGQGNTAQPATGKEELTDKQIQDQIKNTLAKLSGGGNNNFNKQSGANRSKYRKDKRNAHSDAVDEQMQSDLDSSKILQVTEYISASDLASLMDVSVNDVIKTCLSLGMFVSINQRLDAEAITVIADEFGYETKFISAEEEISFDTEEAEDLPEDLLTRAPIVTIMGHVDHGKTSLLDYIRKTKVTAGEAGGITQHIGAYDVMTNAGKRITFLDTPGHEAFTAMRARGAKVTDIVIIVVAADDGVMPQTKEAINHAIVAGVPIVIALNKSDKPGANPDKIKEELSVANILVEDWGGKYQCEAISAKTGMGINELLDKVLLEAEILDLKANPDKKAVGTVVEAMLDKGRGYVTTVLVQAGTLNIGDIILVGAHYGRVKSMNDHTGKKLKKAGPSIPVQILGLPGAPQAGEKLTVMDSERDAREIANKREQIIREQSMRTKKHITLDEIGRRLAIGNFKQLNVIVKGDVDGSVEALSDSLLKLSNEEVQVNILHKGVGQISESDILLASASDAIVVGFQVRPSQSAKKLAEQEEIEIRLYSIIYAAIGDVKDAIQGMLAPKFEEVILGNVQIREVFKVSKVGTIAGCMVTDGFVKRQNEVRLIRDGIVLFTGRIANLKRYKDDVSEVKFGFECGISLDGFNDMLEGDLLESYEMKEIKRK